DPDTKEAGFSFPRKNYFQGRWIKHAGWWPDRIVRLFRKEAGRMTAAIVHESVEVQGMVGFLNTAIEHHTESRLSKIIQRKYSYTYIKNQHIYFKRCIINVRRPSFLTWRFTI